MSDFTVLYPGVYTEREKALAEKFTAGNRAITERGFIDVKALIEGKLPGDTPGVGSTIPVTEAMVRYNSEKYEFENPVMNDAGYARKLGYKDIIAMTAFAAHDDNFMSPYPIKARDTLLVNSLNHSVTSYRPLYPGDTVYLVVNSRNVTDITPPEGSIYRSLAIQTEGSAYNQNGEKVLDVIFRVTENLKIYREGKAPAEFAAWEAPDWMRRPAHYYTDDDWEFIRELWAGEERRGNEPLYWEDVKIGDEPVWTADGPILVSIKPIPPHGMGIGGSRTLKKEITDPAIFKTMIRGEKDGIYRLPNREDYVPAVPGIAPGEHPTPASGDETRSILINYMGREFALRHISNWMGDHGWIRNIRWGIMSPEALAAHGKNVPANPQAERFLEKVPGMQGKYVTTHGMTGDLAIVKSCVYDKYVRDDEFFVEIGWWIENIEGYIWEEGGATVKLPSRKA